MTDAPDQTHALKTLILAASWPDGGTDGFPASVVAQMIADSLVGAGVVVSAPASPPSGEQDLNALSDLSARATPGVWRQEFFRDGELLPDGTGGMDDHESAGSGVYVIDESSDEGYCLTEFDAGLTQDAAFIVAAVNYVREHVLSPGPKGGDPDAAVAHLDQARAHKHESTNESARTVGPPGLGE